MRRYDMDYTKGEWKLNGQYNVECKEGLFYCLESGDSGEGSSCEELQANAQRIVQCVNSHNDLLKACKELRQFLKDGDYINVSGREKFKAIMHQSQQAITKAEAKCL